MPHDPKTLAPEQKVREFIQRHVPDSSRKPIVVAVSGGPDSVCLLHILHRLRRDTALQLHVAHLDHGLRPDSSADAQYVLDLCHKLGLPVTIEQADVPAYRRQYRLTLEEAAREVRYAFLADVAVTIGAKAVAVAHTRDDNVETVLLHIIRGTGTRGLAGLQPVAQRGPVIVIRPLLDVTREETVTYCRRHRLQPRLDPTNLDRGPLRNRVRLELLPLLREYNPGIREALLRTSAIARDDIEVIEAAAGRKYREIARKEESHLVFDKALLQSMPLALQRAVLRRAIGEMSGTLKDIEARHIEEVLALATAPAGKHIDLPYSLTCTSDYDRIVLHRDTEELAAYPAITGEHALNVPGVTEIPGWRIETVLVDPGQPQTDDPLTAMIDAAAVMRDRLTVRARLPGDRFQPLGMAQEKKLGRFMIDARVPIVSRGRVPLVCAGGRILWVAGYRIDERVKLTPSTRQVLKINFKRTTD